MSGPVPDHRYPRDYTDRQLLESIWRKLDGLSAMLASAELQNDIEYVVNGWKRHSDE